MSRLTSTCHQLVTGKVLLNLLCHIHNSKSPIVKMSSDLTTLIEMGFPETRARKALSATQYKGLQVAMDWMIAHESDPDIDEPFQEPEGHRLGDASPSNTDGGDASTEESTDGSTEKKAKSLKCDDCGKLIKAATDMEVHAARTGHQNFSESEEEVKPLTDDQKKEQLSRLQEKMKQRQQEKAAQEKKEALDREKLRRKQGKELTSIKQQKEVEEMKKIAAMKKREKMEDKLAREKVKAEIAKDRAERAARATKASTGNSPSTPEGKSPTSQQPAVKKDYDQARIQVRLPDGSALTHAFSANDQLAAVRLYVETNRTDGSSAPFTLMTTFPKKVFTPQDMDAPLKALGLVPSAVLVTKPL